MTGINAVLACIWPFNMPSSGKLWKPSWGSGFIWQKGKKRIHLDTFQRAVMKESTYVGVLYTRLLYKYLMGYLWGSMYRLAACSLMSEHFVWYRERSRLQPLSVCRGIKFWLPRLLSWPVCCCWNWLFFLLWDASERNEWALSMWKPPF